MQRIVLTALAILFLVLPSAARAELTPPPVQGYVTDTAGKLSPDEVRALDDKLAAYRRCAGDQIAVLVARSLEGSTIEDVGYRTATAWKLGEAGKDNGVLLVLAPSERKVRIEVGKGLEGQLTDLQSNDVLREHVSPNLRKDDFFAAIDEGTSAIGAALWATGPHASCASIPRAIRPAGAATKPAPSPAPAPASDAWSWVLGVIMFVAFSIVGFALTWSRPDGCFELGVHLVISSTFGGLGAIFLSLFAYGLVSSDLARAGIALAVAIGAISLRRWWERRPARPPRASAASSGSSTSYESETSYGPSSSGSSSYGSSSYDSGGSSGDSFGSSDSGFSGGGGGSFGGGGSSDSY